MDDETHDETLKRATQVLAQYDQASEVVYVLKPGEQPTVLANDFCLTDGRQYVNIHTKDVLFSDASFCVYMNLLEQCRLIQVFVRPGFSTAVLEEALKVVQAVLASRDTADKLLSVLHHSQEITHRRVVRRYVVQDRLKCMKCDHYIKSGRTAVVLFHCDVNTTTPTEDDFAGCFHQECYLALMNDDESLPDYRVTMH